MDTTLHDDVFEEHQGARGVHRRWAAWARAVGIAGLTLTVVPGVITALSGGSPPADAAAGQTRTYYIAADTVDWNYAPDGENHITGQPFDDVAGVFTTPGPNRIGTTCTKSLYREYTDASFRTLEPRPAAWAHLGFLGPVIHAEVGDKVRLVFKNNLKRPVSVHMHGLLYDKGSKGAPYVDGSTAAQHGDDAVPPGTSYTYNFTVPDRAGPGPMEGSSVMWMYRSHTDEVGDTYSGLMGPVIVTRADMARTDGSPKDVDREMVSVFQVSDEDQSLDMPANRARLSAAPPADDEEFVESNLMHNINGYVFGNQPLGTTAGTGMTVKAAASTCGGT